MILYDLRGFYKVPFLEKYSIFCGFGTKRYGDGKRGNLNFKTLSGLDTNKNTHYITPKQSHSTNICVVESNSESSPLADGLVTQDKNIVLTVVTADCCPIIYADIRTGIIGISHQGWRGTLERLPNNMILQMVELGAQKENIYCAIGPSIGDCCYLINGKRYLDFKNKFNDDRIFTYFGNDKIGLNIQYSNYKTLLESGIKKDQIIHTPFCTACNFQKFWSYQRDRQILGEMLTFIEIK